MPPEETANTRLALDFANAMAAGDSARAHAMLSTRLQAQMTPDTLARAGAIRHRVGLRRDCQRLLFGLRQIRWGLVVAAALLTELSAIGIFFVLLLGATLHSRRVGVRCCAIVMSATHVACAGDVPLPQPGGEAPRPPVGEAPRSPVLMPSQEESVDALFMKVQSLVGMMPVECGRHYLGRAGTSELEQSLKCGMDAARAKRPFWTFNQLQGIDSWIAEGLVGGPDGAIRSFAYDSSPSGNPADTSRARLTVSPCARPSVVSIAINGSARFSCAERRP